MNDSMLLTRLGDVLALDVDAVPVEPGTEYQFAGVYSFARGLFYRGVINGSDTTYKRFHRLHHGSFVMSQVKGWEGALARVTEGFDGLFLSPVYPTFSPDASRLSVHYLEYFFKQQHTWQILERMSKGIGARRNSVYPDMLLSMQIPLPPLAEQQRIVARIDALVSRIEEAKGLRAQAVAEVEAVIGTVASDLTAVPRWKAAPIREIADVRGGIQKSSKRVPGANPRRYLTVAHVQRNWIDTSDPRYFEVSGQEFARWQLVAGDVLVVEGNGSASQIGRTALFRGEIDACVHQNHVIRVRPKSTVIDPEYLNAYLNSTYGQAQMRELSRTTSGLYNLSVGRIEHIQVPLPPQSEQRRIVAHLNSLQAKVDAVKRLQAETQAELDALLPAVLDRAFRGEL